MDKMFLAFFIVRNIVFKKNDGWGTYSSQEITNLIS